MEKIGFIGLGIMGAAMAANIRRAGYPLVVYNRTPDKAGPLVALGADAASSPRSLAREADIVILMLTGPEAIDEVLWGLEGASPSLDASKILVNMSSVSPRYTRVLAQKLAPLGVGFIDAPVSGTKKPAEDATLIILAGGVREQVDRLAPLFAAMSQKVVYCGPAGQGSMMKMAVNLLLAVMMEGLAEMVTLGLAGGLELDAMLEVVATGAMHSAMYQIKGEMLRAGDYPPNFPLKHMTKDLKFIVDTAFETGAATPAAHTLLQVYRQGVGQGWGDLDFSSVRQVLAQMTGTSWPR